MGIPQNIIIIWSGAINELPQDWFLCDGQNGTPNLSDRFVVGSGSKYILEETGGSNDIVNIAHTHSTGSTNSVPSHTHGVSNSVGGNQRNRLGRANPITGRSTFDSGAHLHNFNTSNAGQSGVNRNIPPYLSLAYIMYGGE